MAGQAQKFRSYPCLSISVQDGAIGKWTFRKERIGTFALAGSSEGTVHGAARDKFCAASAGTWPSVRELGPSNVPRSVYP